jgi:hypothetical protein
VQDKESMLALTRAIDRATGHVFLPPATAPPPGTLPPAPGAPAPNTYALFTSAAGARKGADVRDVQERWIDARDEWDAHADQERKREGEALRQQGERAVAEGKIRKRGGD